MEVVEELKGVVGDEEWKAKFLFLAFKYLLGPTSSNYLNNSSSIFKDIMGNVCGMRWCHLVLERLCDGAWSLKAKMVKHQKGEKVAFNLKGCTLLLEVFYVEHIDCRVLKTLVGQRTSPRFRDWADKLIGRLYKKVGNFDSETVKLFHCITKGGDPICSTGNIVGEIEGCNHEERIKIIEDVVPKPKEGVTVTDEKAQLLLDIVKDSTISVLVAEVRNLREVVKKLEEKIEEKGVSLKFDWGATPKPVNKLGDQLMETATPETLGENDVPSSIGCSNNNCPDLQQEDVNVGANELDADGVQIIVSADTSLAVLERQKGGRQVEGEDMATQPKTVDTEEPATYKKIVTGLLARGKETAVGSDASIHQSEAKNTRQGTKKIGVLKSKEVKKGRANKSSHTKNTKQRVSTRVTRAQRLCLVQT